MDTGAHSWIRKSLNITTTGDRTGEADLPFSDHFCPHFLQIDRYWGVIDFVPDTNFPDIRATSQVHSSTGFCLIVPRERDMVRLYIPLDDHHRYIDPSTKKVDMTVVDPDDLLKVPFHLEFQERPHHPFIDCEEGFPAILHECETGIPLVDGLRW